MIPLPSGVRVVDRDSTPTCKGFAGLSLQVQQILRRDPLSSTDLLSGGRPPPKLAITHKSLTIGGAGKRKLLNRMNRL